jgi:hypothetical protein
MIVYVCFFVFNFCLFFLDWHFFSLKSINLKRLVLLLFILLPGLRQNVGWDYEAYDAFFVQLDKFDWSGICNIFQLGFEYEPLFILLSFLSLKLLIPPYLLFSALISFFYYKIATKYFNSLFYILFVGYTYYGYFHQFSIIRQGLSISLLYYAFLIVVNGKLRLILSMISVFIHYSSFLTLIIFYLSKYFTFSKNFILVVLLSTFPLILFKTNFILSLVNLITFERYLLLTEIDFLNYKVGFSLKYVEIVILILLSLNNSFVKVENKFFFNLLIYELMNYSFFNDMTIAYERFNVIFEFSHIIILTLIVFNYFRNRLLSYCFILVFVLFRYFQFFNSESRNLFELSHYERFFPYHSIFDKLENEL